MSANWTQEYTAKCVPWTPNATQRLQMDLLLKSAQFDSPSHNLAWCSFPDEPNSEQVHLFSAPHKNLQDSSQRYFIDQDPRTTHLAGNLAWSEQWCFFLKNPKCIWKKNQSTSRYVTLYKNPKYHPRCFTNKSKMKIRSKKSEIHHKYTFWAVSRKIPNFFYRSFPPDIQFHGL